MNHVPVVQVRNLNIVAEINKKIMETIFKNILKYTIFCTICFVMFYYIAVPRIIEDRARDLGLMQYSADEDKMIPKDTINISGWDLHYLQHGTMNK